MGNNIAFRKKGYDELGGYEGLGSSILDDEILVRGFARKGYKIAAAFNQNAVVTSGDFSFECEICKNEEIVSVKVKNTNALGLIMIYDGNTVNFKYDEYSKKISGENFEKGNTAIIIYDVINALENEETQKHIIDGGVKYEGKTNFGEFVLVQNDNSTLKSLSFKNSDYRIDFK
jgi:hypothetical protein